MYFFKSFMAVVFFLSIFQNAGAAEFDGVIEPYMVVKVGSGVYGILETVEADRGDFVKKGQVLATLQSSVEKATMEAARARAEMEADIKAKQANLDFYTRKKRMNEELYKKEVLPFSQMDEIETNRILAETQLQDALENKRLAELEFKRSVEVVNRLTIRSPINGVVVERNLSPGEYIENQSVLKLAQIHPLNVEVILPVSQLPFIKVGMRAKVIPEAPQEILLILDGSTGRSSWNSNGLSQVRPRYGKYAVTGNHEYYSGLGQALIFMRKSGFKVLRGDVVTVNNLINIAGICPHISPRQVNSFSKQRS